MVQITEQTTQTKGGDRIAGNYTNINFCPMCGHNQVGIIDASVSTGHVLLPDVAQITRCGNCGHETVVIPQGEE